MTGLSANEQDNINEHYNTEGFPFDPFASVKKQQQLKRDFEEIEKDFKEFFSMEQKLKGPNSRIKGRDINGTLLVTFEESCMGTIKKFTFEKNVVCESCKGDGVEPKSTPHECEECGGSVEVGKSLNMYTGKCKACQGIGLVT